MIVSAIIVRSVGTKGTSLGSVEREVYSMAPKVPVTHAPLASSDLTIDAIEQLLIYVFISHDDRNTTDTDSRRQWQDRGRGLVDSPRQTNRTDGPRHSRLPARISGSCVAMSGPLSYRPRPSLHTGHAAGTYINDSIRFNCAFLRSSGATLGAWTAKLQSRIWL
jgi:hypothetical protein